MAFGLQLANYQQLRDARRLPARARRARRDDLPPELYPGIDYAAHALDPDGHCLQLYYYMEQIGWDGQPRPQSARPRSSPAIWPEDAGAAVRHLQGEPFLGPWG